MQPERQPSAKAGKEADALGQMRLGELLIQRGLITKQILDEALQDQPPSGKRLWEILLERGHVAESQLLPVLAAHLRVPYTDVSAQIWSPEKLDLLPEALARKYTALPLRREGKRLELVMADPLNIKAVEDLSFATGSQVSATLGSRAQILDAIQRFYAKHLDGAAALMAKEIGRASCRERVYVLV